MKELGVPYLTCFAHTLQQGISEGFKKANIVTHVKTIRDVVLLLSHINETRDLFADKQCLIKPGIIPITIPIDCITRYIIF